MVELKDKKILFIGPKTFNYELEIIRELENFYCRVTYINDKLFTNIILIIILRLFPRILWPISTKKFKKMIEFEQKDYFDIVFIIKGEAVSPSLLKWIKENHINARFIMYLWDSVANVKYVASKFKYFDKVLSFDPEDCKKFNNLLYRPLFFVNSYLNKLDAKEKASRLFFLGTLNGDRRIVVSKINEAIKDRFQFEYKLFVRSRIELYIYKLQKYFCIFFGLNFYSIANKNLILEPMSTDQISEKFNNCSVVLDINHPDQSGLTMRTFEVLVSGKKLITTNKNIFFHEFYDESLIEVIDRVNPNPRQVFFETKSASLCNDFYEKYSCRGWILEIFK